MRELHPPVRPPAEELHLLGFERRGLDDRCRSIVFLEPVVDDESASLEILRHRRTGVRRRVLNVRPVDVPPGEREVGLDRFPRVIRIPDDQPADNIHPVSMQVLERIGHRQQ